MATTTGEIGLEGDVLVVRRIHVTYHLKIREEQIETARMVHDIHARHCPVARTLESCVEITTSLEPET